MTDVETRFSQFTRSWLAGESPDPQSALEGLSGADRLELTDLIDGFLEANSPMIDAGPVDPEAFARAQATNPLIQRIGRSAAGVSGVWPSMLPRLRERSRIGREEVAERLASELGRPEGSEKIADYYHRMEWGDLPSSGVNGRVLGALATILDCDASELAEAGVAGNPLPEEFSANHAALPPTAQAFTRFAAGEIGEGVDPADEGPAEHPAWDETDRLFLGG